MLPARARSWPLSFLCLIQMFSPSSSSSSSLDTHRLMMRISAYLWIHTQCTDELPQLVILFWVKKSKRTKVKRSAILPLRRNCATAQFFWSKFVLNSFHIHNCCWRSLFHFCFSFCCCCSFGAAIWVLHKRCNKKKVIYLSTTRNYRGILQPKTAKFPFSSRYCYCC